MTQFSAVEGGIVTLSGSVDDEVGPTLSEDAICSLSGREKQTGGEDEEASSAASTLTAASGVECITGDGCAGR